MTTYQGILKQYWGYDDFRGIQRDIIESIGSGHDTLGLMPTGGGKSITFQVPALAMAGVCIVITPLIALMKDQVYHLRQRGIRAETIHTGVPHQEVLRILENCILGNVKLLYISPERIGSELFLTKLSHMHVSFITVDEAHCISQWGYDFRPAYLDIASLRAVCHVPVLALTATATPQVVKDIQEKLQPLPASPKGRGAYGVTLDVSLRGKLLPKEEAGRGFNVFRMSFERKNLAYVVRHTPDKRRELIHILHRVEGAAIVYARSRQRTKEIAEMLNANGLSATYYHAGLDNETKDQRQKDWQADKTRIIVATTAFGMGIDKPDVRLVAHFDCPDSIEAYFQEAGRAGRDGQKAYAVLLYQAADAGKLQKRVADTFPGRDYVKQVYEQLAFFFQIATGDGRGVLREFDINRFCRSFGHFPIRVESALHLLERAGYIEYEDAPDGQAQVHFLVGRDDLYRLDQVTPDEDRVIIALLRNYGGLFADYGYIDEREVARQAGLTPEQTYDVLKQLSQRRLIHFIPRRNVPTIRYTQRREDKEHVQLPRSIYEERLKQYQQRIAAMLRYAQSDSRCRSRQLLSYFGEESTHDCGQCDVCLSRHTDRRQAEDARRLLLDFLADHQRHHVSELDKIKADSDLLDAALTYLLQEEYIYQEDGFLMLASQS